ncbi:MAG: hypothetical protein NXI31_26400 [bacterium]|nr:hypothetical protein [bacterium]
MKLHHALDDEAWIKRIKAQLPRSRDPVLVVLKGHLLVEEQLDRLIAASCRRPEDLDQARLTFSQKLSLASALIGSFSQKRFVERLNRMRNKLAHRLDGYSLEQELNDVLRSYDSEEFAEYGVAKLSTLRRLGYLKRMVALTCGILAGIAGGMRAARAHSGAPVPPKQDGYP